MSKYGSIVYSLLSNDAALVAAVGMDSGGVGPKVYPVTMPEKEKAPAIVYTKQIQPRDIKAAGDPYKNATAIISVYAMHDDLDRCEDLISKAEQALNINGNTEIVNIRVLSMRWLGRDDEIYDGTTDKYMIRSRFHLMIFEQ